MATPRSDDSELPSAMNLQDLLDMSHTTPEECATSLPAAPTKATIATTDRDSPISEKAFPFQANVAEKIVHLLDTSALSDVTFIVGEEERLHIPAHKLILSMSSPVFTAMFYGEMTKSDLTNARNSSTIEIPDCSPKAFQALLQFVYKGVHPSLTVDDALSVLYASRKYSVHGLEDMCCVILSSSISADNVFDILFSATFYNLAALEYQCWEFIEEHPVQVLEVHLDFMTHDTVRNLLKNEKLNCSEAELFRVLIKWAEKECSKQKLEPTPENIRTACEEELKMIRFPTMSGQEFADVVVPTKILTMEQICQVFTVINASPDNKVKSETQFCGKRRCPKSSVSGIGHERGSNPGNHTVAPTALHNNTHEATHLQQAEGGNNAGQNNGRNRRQSRRSRRRSNPPPT